MSRHGDYLNTMRTNRTSTRPRRLDAAFEAALGGGDTDSERGEMGEMVESVVQTVRSSLVQPPPEPNAEFAAVLEQGLTASEMSGTADDVPSPPVPVATSSGPHGRRMLGAALAKVAALSLFAKLTLGGVTVAMAATGAGAAGVLPGPVQDAFDRVSAIVLGEPPRDDPAPGDSGRPDDGSGTRVEPEPGRPDRDVRDRIEDTDPADRGGDRTLGDDVSDPATQHRRDDTTHDGSPNNTSNGPSSNQDYEPPAPTDPPQTTPQNTEDPPDQPDDPATKNPGRTPDTGPTVKLTP